MTVDLLAAVETFFDSEILPRHREWAKHVVAKAGTPPFVAELRAKAREAGLWNLGLADRMSNAPMRRLPRSRGRLPWASEVFNCQAPDVPNMIMLQHAASAEQKKRWLEPLLDGRIRSAFGMTEPDVASSDATNIATTCDVTAMTGWSTGASGSLPAAPIPDCAFVIVMGVSRPEASRTGRHSCVIVPMPSPGLRVVRELRFLGWEDSIAPIAELDFDDVRVPVANLLGEEGEGFAAAQVRLGPARLHHCMRAIGACEVLVELMMARAAERRAFGRAVIDYDSRSRPLPAPCRDRAGPPAGAAHCGAVGQRRTSGRLARRFDGEGRRTGDGPAHRRSRFATLRGDGRQRRCADPSRLCSCAHAAHCRWAGRGPFAADIPARTSRPLDHFRITLYYAGR